MKRPLKSLNEKNWKGPVKSWPFKGVGLQSVKWAIHQLHPGSNPQMPVSRNWGHVILKEATTTVDPQFISYDFGGREKNLFHLKYIWIIQQKMITMKSN